MQLHFISTNNRYAPAHLHFVLNVHYSAVMNGEGQVV